MERDFHLQLFTNDQCSLEIARKIITKDALKQPYMLMFLQKILKNDVRRL